MNIDAITQYILAIAPAITALVGMAVVIGVGIAKIKNALAGNETKVDEISSRNSKVLKEIADGSKAIIEQNTELRRENKELKKTLEELNKKIEIIDTIKAVNKR